MKNGMSFDNVIANPVFGKHKKILQSMQYLVTPVIHQMLLELFREESLDAMEGHGS